MQETHELEHELTRIGLGQEIRKSGTKLMEGFHKVENEMADTGLDKEVQKGEHNLEDEFHKPEYDQHKLGLGQDLRRGEYDLKRGSSHGQRSRSNESIFRARGESFGRSAVKGAAMAAEYGTMAFDRAPSTNRASSSRPNVPRPSHDMINPKDQRTLGSICQPSTGATHPQGVPGLHPAPNAQIFTQPPANIQKPLSMKEPAHHPLLQMPQPGHNHGPSGRFLLLTREWTRLQGGCRVQGHMQRSQKPVRKPVLPPRPQVSPQQQTLARMPPPAEIQALQGIPQHPLQPQSSQRAQQSPSQPQHAQEAPLHPLQLRHSQNAQRHSQSAIHPNPQPPHPQGAPQHPHNIIPQHPQPPDRHGPPQQNK
ncbi:hypothetical protein BDR22DRAFT_821381 [Usnea florida]